MFRLFESFIDPFPETRQGQPPTTLWAFAWHYMWDARWAVITLSVLSAAVAVGEVMLFGFLGQIVDWLAASNPETFFRDEGQRLLVIAVAVGIGLPLLNLVSGLLMHQTLLGNTPMSARWRMHRFLLGQSMTFFANEFAGRVSTKLMQSALAVREMVMKVMDIFVYVAVYFIAMVALIASADLRLAAPLAVWLLVYAGLVWWFVPRLAAISEKQADARSAMTGRIVDSYTNIATVKLFSHAKREEAYAQEGMQDFLDTVHPQMRLVTAFHGIVYFNNCLLVVAIAGLGIHFWLGGAISIGAIATAVALALRVNGMSQWIMWEVSALFENIGIAYDGISMMTKPRDIEDAPDAKPLVVDKGAIAFEKVQFHYGKETGVIENLSLSIAAGEKVGLVGRSGAGKSTLVNLLLRFYDLERGRITIDGADVSDVTQASLRAHIGMVTQDTSLLHRSIRENIAYGRPEASEAEVIEAARRANALDFITTLVDKDGRSGLDAQVGERGVKLSGGQRQRIAIARIFLKDAPILVLDEATSALDSEVEAAIQDSLFELMEDKTVIAIAHRLSTIAAMDRLIVLDRGAVVEQGTHDALANAGGLYAELWARQSGGFLASPAKAAE
ncbi:MAG: ABC transporter ATP-binding protein [Pseudomonadota bacterium]